MSANKYIQILKDAKKIALETPEHFLTVMQVMLEEPTNNDGTQIERWKDALDYLEDYLDTFLKYRSSFSRELMELYNYYELKQLHKNKTK